MFALGMGSSALAVLTKQVGAAAAAPISAVAADGWQATMATPAELALSPVSVSRQGFSGAGAPTTIAETLRTTKRMRQAYPNHALLTASSVALSDYIYGTDTIAGVANNSGEISPKPVAAIVSPARLTVGNTIGGDVVPLEVVAGHRNASGGKEVACVKFIVTDGTITINVVVDTPTSSNRTGDRNTVLAYRLPATDITALTGFVNGVSSGLITVNVEVYPRIGADHATYALSSVLKSAQSAVARECSPRYFLKNTGGKTKYVVETAANGGNDGTGAGHIVQGIAEATPFLTVLAAINKAHTDLGATSGIDMAEIQIGNDGGTPFVLASTAATRTQKIGALTITRKPGVARANARVSFGAAAFRPRFGGALVAPVATGAIHFRDLAIVRTGALTIQGEAGTQLDILFDDCDFDNGGFTATWLANSHDRFFGVTFTNLTGNSALGSATGEHRLMRGVSVDPNFGSLEGWWTIGCAFTRPGLFGRGTRTFDGAVWAFNRFRNPIATAVMIAIGVDQDVSQVAIIQNLFEWTSATTAAVIRISGDAASGDNSHVILHANTCAGMFEAGRWNVFYDDGATRRTSKLQSVVGNIAVAIFTKSDVFRGANEGGLDAATATGNWAFKHGVGCRGNFTQFQSADPVGQGSNQAQDYAGLDADYGTSQAVRNDPLFTAYAGTKTVAEGDGAGAGGGDYTLQAGSDAKDLVADAVLSLDLAGNARAAVNDAAGAFAGWG